MTGENLETENLLTGRERMRQCSIGRRSALPPKAVAQAVLQDRVEFPEDLDGRAMVVERQQSVDQRVDGQSSGTHRRVAKEEVLPWEVVMLLAFQDVP